MAAGVVDFEIPNHASLVFILVEGDPGSFRWTPWLVSGALLPATMHLVCLLASLKILTARTNRDFTYLKMVAIVELLAGAILSVSLGFFAFLALFLMFAIAAFSSGEVRRSAQAKRAVVRGGLRAFPRRLVSISVLLFGGILFMTAGLFFVLPRTARAAIERIMPRHNHVSGFFEDGVTLGQIGELKKNTAPVMHVRSHRIGDDGGGGFLEVRWRGAALTRFDQAKAVGCPLAGPIVLPKPDPRARWSPITVNRAARPRPPPRHQLCSKDERAGRGILCSSRAFPQTIRIDVPSSATHALPVLHGRRAGGHARADLRGVQLPGRGLGWKRYARSALPSRQRRGTASASGRVSIRGFNISPAKWRRARRTITELAPAPSRAASAWITMLHASGTAARRGSRSAREFSFRPQERALLRSTSPPRWLSCSARREFRRG